MTDERTGRRSGGRAERVAQRALPPAVNPCSPGQRGGQYRPLSDADMVAIYQTALRLLAELGVGEVPEVLVKPFLVAGARLGGGRVYFPQELVEKVIGMAAKTFTFHGRDTARSIEVGGDHVHFGTGGAAVLTLDIDTGGYRPSTLRDLYDFTRLQDTLTNVSWFTRCCVATDLPDIYELDVNTVFALMKGTTKPVATSFTIHEHVAPIMRMVDMGLGGDGTSGLFRETPFLKAHISPMISPMRYGEDAVMVTLACMAHGIPLSCITAAQSGATAPATLAGFLAQSLAETLASLIMVNVIKPGHPMVFSNWPLVVDLRTGSFVGGGGEISVMNAASAQISNWLGLPSGVASSMTDAKVPDAQYGSEKGISSLAAALAGGNLIYESSGMMASLLGASFEAFILDDEMHSLIYRTLRGVEVNDETLGYEAIREAVLGPGHFLGGAHTIAAMQRDYFYPTIADRDAPMTWDEKGRHDAWGRAKLAARRVLETHHPTYLTPEAEARMRAEFPILLGP
ncbi:MAG: trimethylamine methyltransferase family protein [Roseovarius sp.]|uniref:trimethylamine methyltransferase family protein n=1 Tax=Roseovarius sp. TaxID=1486281 RepID=UPI001B47A237|nr:trimethylamine methyltransferase family protein [Roseovarius sp.]MBQ0752307.1 trimethylamine methyltransferase family protein [Roseovarius sp.]MBQ0810322.1 trimethylamine methyltransferase family protein [Roseovarius sp.]